MSKHVKIDPGHGGSDPGAVGNDLIEKILNLHVAFALRTYLLTNYEVTVSVTREVDITLDKDTRIAKAIEGNPDLCVSIHHNGFGSPTARGGEVIDGHDCQEDDKLSNDILLGWNKLGMPTRRRFSKIDSTGKDWYFMIREVIKNGKTKAIITEGGFVTNPEDAKLLKSNGYLVKEAHAIGEAIAKFLNLQPKKIEPKILYRVQVGGFYIKSNADRLKKELESKGYKPFIIEVKQ